MTLEYDLLVVGGGINGAGIARDAAGRGLRVLLCEQHDLAQHTSSASTKLIHGGLRYLEYYEFKLVRKALQEREVLLRSAPHIIWPLRFVMPHDANQRPAWMIRAGLFMYDHLAKREILPPSEGANLARHDAGQPLKGDYRKGFVYSDGWVDDARLVVLNAMDAQERGARILTRTKCISARREGDIWHAVLEHQREGGVQQEEVRARAIVNAAGPWAARFAQAVPQAKSGRSLRLIKGSHIVVKRMFDHPYAYIFQNPDKRIIFAIPYQEEFTLIGTTDLEYHGDAGKVEIDAAEIDYLCDMANRYFKRQIGKEDVVWTYSGVRPLCDDESDSPQAITRDYTLDIHDVDGQAPLLSVFGGKLTTYRKLAEHALEKLAPYYKGIGPAWTKGAVLPGGDIGDNRDDYAAKLRRRFPFITEGMARHYARTYGSNTELFLADAKDIADLGEHFGHELYEAELRYLVEHEWVRRLDDAIWRRTKEGMWLNAEQQSRVAQWLQQNAGKRELSLAS